MSEIKNQGALGNYIDRKFRITERGSDIRREVGGGLTTFFAMVYILMVNADMLSSLGVSYGAIYVATAISAVLGTVLTGLLANLPLAQASAMGLNAYFVFTFCGQMGFTYANALVAVLFDGLVFFILTVTGGRRLIVNAIPASVRSAISVGIGLFIALIGLENAKMVVADPATCVTLHSLNLMNNSWAEIMPIIVCVLTLLIIAVLDHRKVKGAVLLGMLGGAALYYLLGLTVSGFYTGAEPIVSVSFENPLNSFKQFGQESFGAVFRSGFDFSAYIEAHGTGNFVLTLVTSVLAMCMLDMFDTLGTMYATCDRGGLLKGKGIEKSMDRGMIADALATMGGSVCGTSTVSTFVESASGIAAGARTGFASVVTGLLFLAAMFFSPLARLIPGCATSAVLVYVGVLMMQSVKGIDWKDISCSVPAFLTVALIPFTYNVSFGIAFGLISHVVILLFTGRIKEIKVSSVIISVLFLLTLFFTH